MRFGRSWPLQGVEIDDGCGLEGDVLGATIGVQDAVVLGRGDFRFGNQEFRHVGQVRECVAEVLAHELAWLDRGVEDRDAVIVLEKTAREIELRSFAEIIRRRA